MADEVTARHALPEFSVECALELHREGRLVEAEQIYRAIAAADPGNFPALHLSGLLAYQQGRLADALRLVAAALKARPASAEALMDYGAILDALGRPEEALANYDRLLPARADDARLHYNRGNVQKRLGCFPEALASYDRALALAPGLAAAHQNRGVTLVELGREEEALPSFEQALALAPDLAQRIEALSNSGKILSRLKRYDAALANYDGLLKICPDHTDGLLRRGGVLAVLGRYDEAIAHYEQALRIAPCLVDAHLFRGNALIALDRVDEALRAFCDAGAIDPQYPTAKFNEGMVRLCLGDFRAGWEKYESRWDTSEYAAERPTYPRPQWRGERDVAGKTILLCAEQGMGDAIQFVRYAPLVAALGAKVLLGVHGPLVSLLSTVPGVSQVIADGGTLPHFDLYTPLLSLPLAFGTELATIPAHVPYIRADEERIAKWRERMPRNGRLRIGVCWAGTSVHPNNRNRSIALERFARIFSVSGLDFVSLQKDVTGADVAILSRHGITHFADEFADFADTAAVVRMLDLLVTVDTSVAHLAGAMGKAVAVLIPFAPDFRWMRERTDSPWYPTMRLFRQNAIGDWDTPLERLRQELTAVASRPAGVPR
jgi:tetratricopeptide (TPR) repeat protein